jgi:hypothetical protein
MKATADDWQRQAFEEGVPIPYSASFDLEAFARLQNGLIPRAMEDKWFVYYDAPHLYFHRSWTGLPVYKIVIDETDEGAVVSDALWSKPLADEPNADPTYQARLLDFLVSNLLLGQTKPFPQPDAAHALPRVAHQHHIAGTGYSETIEGHAATSDSTGARKPKRRLRDRVSGLLAICAAVVVGAAILLSSLWRKKINR